MRHNFAVSLLVVLLLASALLLTGCGFFNQPGKTPAEVHRDQLRTLRVNQQEMMSDIDRTLGVDQPSKLTDKKLP
jgi:outer membrane lipopolysaccharide assembly protein LptE/RlpB